MNDSYARDLDLNLLRVFVVVAEQRSVTQAAARLYLTQPAVSAALQRLSTAIGAALFVRQGRGLVLTARGDQLLASARLHLAALVTAALAPTAFDPKTSERTLRLGLADAAEVWLLPALLHAFEREAPRMRVISIPVNFRTVGAALADQRIDASITVADELPATIRREPLHGNEFVCLYDPRHARPGRLTEAAYFARDHVVVSYNGDLRGVIEDTLRKQRRIRCSVSTFANLGPLVDGSALLATVPEVVGALRPDPPPRARDRPAAVRDRDDVDRAALAGRARRRRAVAVRARLDPPDRADPGGRARTSRPHVAAAGDPRVQSGDSGSSFSRNRRIRTRSCWRAL